MALFHTMNARTELLKIVMVLSVTTLPGQVAQEQIRVTSDRYLCA